MQETTQLRHRGPDQDVSPPGFLHPRPVLRLMTSLLRCASLLVLFLTAVSAQIRLYDPANDDLANKTRDAFTEFSKGDANIFDTMVSNTLAMKAATLAQLNDLNRQSRADKINLIPLLTWDQLLAEVTSNQKTFLIAYKGAHKILDEALNKPVDPAIQGAGDLKTALAAAKQKLAGLQKEKEVKQKGLDDAAPTLEALKKSLDKLRDEAAASTKPIKQLSDLSEFSHLEGVWGSIKDLRAWFEAAEKASNTPGLQLSILDLGVQHQQIEVDRLKLQVGQADAARKILERMELRLFSVWGDADVDDKGRFKQGLFHHVYANIAPCAGAGCSTNPFVTEQNRREQILETIGKLAETAKLEVGKPPKATTQLRNLLDVLGRFVALVGYQKYLLLADAVEAGTDTHLFAIRLSALNTKDREMLVSHGLDGLAAYHAGGLKPEEIANFFRAAQSIAVGVLAGRVR